MAKWDFWRDRWSQLLLGLAALLDLALFAYLAAVYGRLPEEVPLHFNRAGLPDRTGVPSGLFVLPLAGLLAWLANGSVGLFFYQARRERPVAYILWGATVAIELAAWLALVGLLA
ncbi:MAG: DUF1648 domain-containing protein [Chloroflexi bacterium]|nr:DUF1648 domain-containing protein [Chloroflexota bacterium]MCI0575550.1 DUF1648 domain-containing protein [Chloroflexota bacterium]MCI0644090.1 DUF1648 domain-containing protein [Chloroflexota bacterium]MCI0727906.1 DUF1648 domain-containing protein [Chloroflexota bacterium]